MQTRWGRKRTREVIQRAHDLIEDGSRWGTGGLYSGGRYCAVGAVGKASTVRPRSYNSARQLLDEIAREMYGARSIMSLNDSYGRFSETWPWGGKRVAHRQVLNVMEEAIRRLTPPPPPLPEAPIEKVPELKTRINERTDLAAPPSSEDLSVLEELFS